MKLVDVIVRQEDGTWSAWSPTAPGFYASDERYQELGKLVHSGTRLYFEGEDVQVLQHMERVLGDDLVLRIAYDAHQGDRVQVAERMQRAQWVPEQAERMREEPRNDLGEHVVVCAVPTDTLGFLIRQLAEGDSLHVAVALADEHVLSFYLTNAPAHGGPSLADFGLSEDSTVADLVKVLPIRGGEPDETRTTLLVA